MYDLDREVLCLFRRIKNLFVCVSFGKNAKVILGCSKADKSQLNVLKALKSQ